MKRIEEMDHYEILNISPGASRKEIEKAYLIGRAAYDKKSLAHYSLLSEEEREHILERIEEAFKILSDPEEKKSYDSKKFTFRSFDKGKAHFRKSTAPMRFEDADAKQGIWKKIKGLVSKDA